MGFDMALRVVGAGAGRTGTMSLKIAPGRLLGQTCHHMAEDYNRPEHVPCGEKRRPAGMWTGPGCSPATQRHPTFLPVFSGARSWRPIPGPWSSSLPGETAAAGGPAPVRPFSASTRQRSPRKGPTGPTCGGRSPRPGLRGAGRTRTRPGTPTNAITPRCVPPDQLMDWQASQGWGPCARRSGLTNLTSPFPMSTPAQATG